MAEMTLEQVRDWHAEEYEIWQAACEYDRAQHSFACMRAIEAAIAERKVPAWQPIETAPTTGRELILLLVPREPDNTLWPQVAFPNRWWIKPTHWMPLPAAPKVAP